MTLSSIFS